MIVMIAITRTTFCTSYSTRTMIRVVKGGDIIAPKKKCMWYCCPLGSLQESLLVAAAAAEQLVFYDTMVMIVRTIFRM